VRARPGSPRRPRSQRRRARRPGRPPRRPARPGVRLPRGRRLADQHNCYGCHVQAVTFEALTVGPRAPLRRERDRVPRGAARAHGHQRRPPPRGRLSVGGSGHARDLPRLRRGGLRPLRPHRGRRPPRRPPRGRHAARRAPEPRRVGAQRRHPLPRGAGPPPGHHAGAPDLAPGLLAQRRRALARPGAPAEAWLQSQARRAHRPARRGHRRPQLRRDGPARSGRAAQRGGLVARSPRGCASGSRPTAAGASAPPEANAFATGQSLHALRSLGPATTTRRSPAEPAGWSPTRPRTVAGPTADRARPRRCGRCSGW
jgi:hypothetical protein